MVESHDLFDEGQEVLYSVEVENSVALRTKEWIWIAVHRGAMSVLADERPFQVFPPAVDIDINEIDVFTRIGGIASNDTWGKESTIRCYILKSDVSHVDRWLSLTVLERIRHTAWTSTIWLLLLLWTDVDSEPDWEVDLDVLVEDVCDLTRTRSWVSLDIDGLHGISKLDILEVNTSHTSMAVSRRN